MAAAGLAENDLGIEAGLLVHLVDKVFHEGAQEVALAKLEYALGRVLEQVAVVAQLLQGLI